jgi:hypothetical protein
LRGFEDFAERLIKCVWRPRLRAFSYFCGHEERTGWVVDWKGIQNGYKTGTKRV